LLFPVYKPTFLSPGYQDNLGWGFATALGAQHPRPDAPVVAITGDGGFMYTATELATAMLHQIPLTTIVFNDGAFGNVRRIQQEPYGNRLIGASLPIRISSPLPRASAPRRRARARRKNCAAPSGAHWKIAPARALSRSPSAPCQAHGSSFSWTRFAAGEALWPGFRVLPPRAA
jgi:hypothetical protein